MKRIKISDFKLLQLLNRVPFFKLFSPNERAAFFAHSMNFLQCSEGEEIIKEGCEKNDFFIILAGSATVYINDGQDAVAKVEAGYFIGEGAFIASRPRTASVVADIETFVIRMDQTDLMRFPASVREKLKDQIINGMAMRIADMNSKSIKEPAPEYYNPNDEAEAE